MNDKGITPATLIAAIVVVIMTLGIGGTLVQTQLSHVAEIQSAAEKAISDRDVMILDRVKTLEEASRKSARDPVEKATLDAIVEGIDKREELFQAQTSTQITDINRQIAAALISIGTNAETTVKKPALLPP